MKRREIARKFPEIVEFAGVEQFIDTPVKRYSSGMSVRLAFAVAAHLEPEILLVDEVLAVGDAEFQRRCLGRMEDLSDSGRTVSSSRTRCRRSRSSATGRSGSTKGEIVLDGPSAEVVAHYLQSGFGGTGRAASGPISRRRRATISCGCARSASSQDEEEAGCGRRPPPGRDRDRLHGPPPRDPPVFPKIKVVDQRGDVAFNAMDTSARWHEPRRARRLRRRRPGSRGTSSTRGWRPSHVGDLLARRARSSIRTRAATDAVSFHVQDPGEGDSARGLFTGQWKGSSGRCSTGRPRSAELVRIVGIVLVRNEDVYRRAGDPERRRASATGSTSSTTCRRTARRRSSARSPASSTISTCGGPARARVSHELLEPYAGTDTWVLRRRRRRALRPGGSRPAPRDDSAEASSRTPSGCRQRAALRLARRAAPTRHRVPLAAGRPDHEALQLRRDRRLDRLRPSG